MQTAHAPAVATTLAELASIAAPLRTKGTLALVPTMGALHDGHLDLVRQAGQMADAVAVSIFVNPAQFAPHEDFDRYPRQLAADVAKLAPHGVALVWAPTPKVMYPDGFATRILPAGAADGLETQFRPHFFGGVTTVCCKLFNQVRPDFAIFGEKDYQQLTVLKQMVRDLNMPLKIVPAPTRREADGLALSSRNAYLSAEERAIAPALHKALVACSAAVASGASTAAASAHAAHKILTAGFASVDYVAVRDAETLGEPRPHQPMRILAAAWLGRTRLIDNIPA